MGRGYPLPIMPSSKQIPQRWGHLVLLEQTDDSTSLQIQVYIGEGWARG